MTRLYGRAPKGRRAHGHAPHGHWRVRTMIASIRADGETACMSIDSPTDRDVFLAFTVNVLVPTLRPGDIVVMDNLGAHKSAGVQDAIRAAGAEIEALLRAAEARTSCALDSAITNALLAVTPSDARAWVTS